MGKRYKRKARFFAAFPDWSRKKCAQIHKINPQFECCRDTSTLISLKSIFKKLTTQEHEGAQKRLKTKKSGTLCSFVRLGGLYSSSLIKSFSVISLVVSRHVSPSFLL
jgi:hypothetical protein